MEEVRKSRKIGSVIKIFFVIFIVLILTISLITVKKTVKLGARASSIPAFPGAEGFGSTTPGGRGGKTLFVTNLEDYTKGESKIPGSLRAAIETPGPRIIIFKTGGTIKLKSQLHIIEPYITIAGQTAPGDGITLRDAPFTVATHDVIIRNIRSRVGDDKKGSEPENRDSLSISGTRAKGGDVYNVILDHSSISWAIDENLSTWTDKVHDITIQWNIISEGLRCNLHQEANAKPDCHSMGLLIGDHSKNISVHHNLIAHNNDRNPLIQANTSTEFVNNIVYNWGGGAYPIKFSDSNKVNKPALATVINNYFKRGPNSTTASRVGILLTDNLETGTKIYINGNTFYNKDGTLLATDKILGNLQFRTSAPPIGSGLKAAKIDTDIKSQTLQVGAISPKRDAIDHYIINTFEKGQGAIIDCIVSCDNKDVRPAHGGWQSTSGGTPPKDTDLDGIPDSWETSHSLNPTRSSDAKEYSPLGYTWIEEYINSLIPQNITQ
jgi:hypothetical protein